MIQQAVILAAGNGSRIKRFKGDVPKPLRMVAGLSLIKRAILTAKLAGIQEVVVVVGYKKEAILKSLQHDKSLGVRLKFVVNEEWEKSNGLSLICAKPVVHGEFLLMMADHVLEVGAIREMLQSSLGPHDVLLGIDKRLGKIFDPADATKVALQGNKIIGIGKQLTDYQAYDTGVFLCNPALIHSLEEIHAVKEDVTLSEGVEALAKRGKARSFDLSRYFWQDIDTPEALEAAEKDLFQQLRKPTDGFISKHFNRYLSIFVTRLLIKTPLTANQVTGLVTTVGVLSGLLVSSGRYFDVMLGGVLFQLASILDGCDGEISKLKLTYSQWGEWFDTLSDNLTYVVFLAGVTVGIYNQGIYPHVMFEATLMFLGLLLTLGIMFYYLFRYTNSGSLITIQKDLHQEERANPLPGFSSWLTKIKFMMKRDFFAFLFMILAVTDQLTFILHLAVIGTNLTWMIVLAYKKEIFKIETAKVVETSR